MERIGLAPGTPIGGYTIVAPLGSGGMGAVYRAVDDGGAQVALKLLHPDVGADPVARERLVREAAALQRLRHRGVARVLDVEADSTEAFLVTELIGGQSLDQLVRGAGPLDEAALARLAAELGDALAAVHAAGVVHRDLKPSNVMMTATGPVLIDFGLAHAVGDSHVTSTGLVAGTPGYLAPELLDGAEPGPAADLWGWAAVLAFAATGRPPFGTGQVGTVLARSRAGEPDLAGLPARTAAVLRAALAAEPAARVPPTDVVAALAAQSRGEPWTDAEPTQVVVDRDAVTVVAPVAVPGVTGAAAGPANDGRTRLLPLDGEQRPGAADLSQDETVLVGAPSDRAAGAAWADRAQPAVDRSLDLSVDPEDDLAEDRDGAGPRSGVAGERLDDDADAVGPGEGEDGGYRRPPTRRRWGTMLALAVLVGAAGAQVPVLTLAVVGVLLVVVRTVGSSVETMHARRERVGVRGTDLARALVTLPWHLVLAVLAVLPAAVVGASVVVIVLGLAWWLIGSGQWALTDAAPGQTPGGSEVSVLVGAVLLIGVVVAWYGPLARLTRIGARRTLAAITPGRLGAALVVVAALAATVALIARVLAGEPISWWPAPAPRLPEP